MMSSSQHPIADASSASSNSDEDTKDSTGISSEPHDKSSHKSGYIGSMIRKLSAQIESSNGVSLQVNTSLESTTDADSPSSSVSVAALRGRFEAISSLFDSITTKKHSDSADDIKDVCDANSNLLISKNDNFLRKNVGNEVSAQIETSVKLDCDTVLVTNDSNFVEEGAISVTEMSTTEASTCYSTENHENGGGMFEDTTGGETTEDTAAEVTSSSDEELEDYEMECKVFMQDLVRRIFHESGSITQVDNHKFDQYCRTAEGRKWFARLVDGKRIYNKCVPEQTFYRLVQFFAVCLFECKESDDFSPAKHLMNMCFTFYHNQEGIPCNYDDVINQSYLYTHLNNQKIWRDQRFWTAAFMDSVHSEKKKRMPTGRENWRKQTQEERENTELLHENITFGQLAAFTHNMMHLGLPRSMCEEFVEKQSVIGSLNDYQIEMLIGNINAHYDKDKKQEEKSVEEDKLAKTLQKSINKIKRKIPGIL